MELVFNELSLLPIALDFETANSNVINLIKTMIAVQQVGFKRTIFPRDIYTSLIAKDKSFVKWLNDATPLHRDLFYANARSPFVDEGDTLFEQFFVEIDPRVVNCPIPESTNKPAYGVAVAHYRNTMSISYESHVFLETT